MCVSSFIAQLQEGVTDPPSVSSISRLLRGGPPDGRKDDDGRKDYSIHGILGGKCGRLSYFFVFQLPGRNWPRSFAWVVGGKRLGTFGSKQNETGSCMSEESEDD